MNSFLQAFADGAGHIFCLDAVDHILFLLALIARFDFKSVRLIFWMVTAFTLGHAITFILAASGLTPSVRSWAEAAIPLTIALTAIVNMSSGNQKGRKQSINGFIYAMAVLFGAIHGLAIGSMLKMKIVGEGFVAQLLGFNLGVELAQLLVVVIILVFQFLLMAMFNIRDYSWKIGVSGVALGASVLLLLEKL